MAKFWDENMSSDEMHDTMRETPVYQWIMEEGREEGRKEMLETLRQAIIEIVQKRFPKITSLAMQQVAMLDDPTMLRELNVQISIAHSMKEAKQYLLTIGIDEKPD